MGDVELAETLRRRGIQDERVLQAVGSIERAEFVPPESRAEAGGDYPLPIGFGQTISQPYIVAYMTEALGLRGEERALEIGTGSGYQTALLAQLCREVYSIEIFPELARDAEERLRRLGFENVQVRLGNGYHGWPEAAPFDVIIVTAAPERIPEELLAQLAEGGRMIAPVGEWVDAQDLVLLEKRGSEILSRRLLPVRFVPMRHEEGMA